MNVRTHILTYLLIFLILAACQPQAMPVSTVAPSPNRNAALPPAQKPTLTGSFVYTIGDGTLWLMDASGANKRVLFQATGDTYADTPTFSPDGKAVAFAASVVNKEGTVQSDIRAINVDGSNARVIAAPEYPKIAFATPGYSPDGAQVYFTQSHVVPQAGQKDEIHRVSANGGNVSKVLDNARDPNISSDGKRIAFLRFDYSTYLGGLWVADLDGRNAKQLVDNDAFIAISTPRWSPDMQGVLFAASGSPRKKMPGAITHSESNHDDNCYYALLSNCLIHRASAHGLPWDLWLVSVDGSKFEKITDIGSDSPQPAWSRDGKSIAFFDATGIYVFDRERRAVFEIAKISGYGGFDWR